MSVERQLVATAFQQELWAEATTEMLLDPESFDPKDQADFYSTGLATAVVAGDMTIEDLRNLSVEMNTLDREAAEKSQGDIERFGDADYFEAVARRIGNKTTNVALNMVRSDSLRRSYARRHLKQTEEPMPGMGMPEPKYLPL